MFFHKIVPSGPYLVNYIKSKVLFVYPYPSHVPVDSFNYLINQEHIFRGDKIGVIQPAVVMNHVGTTHGGS